MTVLHLTRDEKFIPLLQSLFEEALPGRHRWLVVTRARREQRFVVPAPNVQFRREWWLRTPLVALDMGGAQAIVAHSMTTAFANVIARAPASTGVAWLGWGYDYQPLLEPLLGDSLLPATRALLGRRAPAVNAGATRKRGLQRVAGRLTSCSIIPASLPLLRQVVPALVAPHHELPLYTAEDTFSGEPAWMDGDDVLLGNSATATNNHADALALLAQHLGQRRLLTPLSYGDAGYGDKVEALGRQLLGDRFDPMRRWMALADYNRAVGNCGFVVMNHVRQQAVGNIGAALYRGATVYLRPENPLMAYYRDLGVVVRSVADLGADGPGLVRLSLDERQANRRIIGAHYARQRVVQAIRGLPALAGL